jgi:hypothetical protein
MEVTFYNESKSSLIHELEIYHAFVSSLFADTIHLRCHNSTLYNLHKGNHQWSDQKLWELFDLFEKHTHGELGLKREQIEIILTNMSKLRKIRHKNKTDNRLIDQGLGFKKKLKELFEKFLEDVLTDNRVFGLQSVIDKKIVRVYDKLSAVPDKHENTYIRELGAVFNDKNTYQVYGESVLKIYWMLKFNLAGSKWLPGWIKRRFDSIAVEILNFPLICDLAADQLLYLREQLYPEFGEIKNQLDQFRQAIAGLKFQPEHFKRIAGLFNQHIGNLRQPLQQKVDQQLYIQFMRNNYKDYGLKLFLVIAPVSKMIEYYYKTGIVPIEVNEALKRNLRREMDLSRCDVFFHVSVTSNLKGDRRKDKKQLQPDA